jgi:aerobic-type carbon monoxide dehydrogenase small subunit (CoxS/CutS family)
MVDIKEVTVNINGLSYTKSIESRTTLVDFIRHECGLTGTHVGCEHGACGACTVLVDGHSTRSCLMLGVQCQGKQVQTVEGLASEGVLNVLQQAFQDHHALQCGFCTAGILMTMTEFLRDNTDPTELEVRDILSGNVCRCTGYLPIVQAVLDAAKTLRGMKQ